MVSITVLYKELKVKKVPIDEIDTLPKDDVLFIKLSTDEREGKDGNISQINGFDNYALLKKSEGGSDWYMLFGYDDEDFIWKRECSSCENRKVVDAPIGTMHVTFRGVFVTDEVWSQAIEITNTL